MYSTRGLQLVMRASVWLCNAGCAICLDLWLPLPVCPVRDDNLLLDGCPFCSYHVIL